ncbi:hypothetical protein G5B30_02890 [Sphingobacterium sp. SGG-5]|uniref:hypothetical protein n=1 Tax=Sphingobacterium sp. SGG-5 TaxID=2710881 RepID=UPI0013E9BD4C|nr:hypothetical protein [Sphingobacterium sp. SGG-5]NGM60858.1 hypothetical protein [Sphingobacterium sp. SGG-5]
MKIINFLTCAILFLVLVACSKETETSPISISDEEGGFYNIRFSVSGFTESHRPFEKLASTSVSDKPIVSDLIYTILDKDKRPIDTLMRSANQNINNLSLKLPNGKYTIRILGLNLTEYIPSYIKNESLDFLLRYQTLPTFGNSYNPSDIFVFNKAIEVTKDSLYSPFILQRFNSKLDLKLLDEIPSNIKTLEVATQSAHQILVANSNSFSNLTNIITYNSSSYRSVYFDITPYGGLSNQIFSANILTPGQEYSQLSEKLLTLKISAYDVDDNLVVTKEVTNVKFTPNTITELSGKLFDDVGNEKQNSLSVIFDESFSTNIIKQEF